MSILQGCGWLDKDHFEKINMPYVVGWTEMESNRAVHRTTPDCNGCYETLIGGYVFAVGYNDNFIISKQHPTGDTSITKYFIIDMAKNKVAFDKTGIYGPLEKPKFDSLSNHLGIKNILFNLNYPENP